MNRWLFAALVVIGAAVLGATVLREPIALAAQAVDATIIGPLDGGGNVKVHEQVPPRAFSLVASAQAGPITGSDPPGTNYAITSVTFTNFSDSGQNDQLHAHYGDQCKAKDPGDDPGPAATVAPNSNVHLDFPQPFVFSAKAGAVSCLTHSGDTRILVVGYRF